MYFASSYWPADVPDTLWQFDLLIPASRRNFPFVGIAVTWQFIVAFIAGCFLIGAFAWKRFSEPSYDVNTRAFRDFRDFSIWNLKDSVSLRRAYVVYCISLVFIFAALAFFGRIIVQLANQLNVSGLQIDVGVVDFSSWKWPLALALGIAGFAPLVNPLVPAEHWLRRFSHEVVGIPTRIREKAVRIRTLIDGAPSGADAGQTAKWVRATLGSKLDGCFLLAKNLQTIVDWSYKEHVRWSDPEIRRKLNEYERTVREETEAALDEFDFLTDPVRLPDRAASGGQGRLQQYEKRLLACFSALEQARDKFAIVLAVYCEHGSRFNGMEKGELKRAIVEMSDIREPRATGLPLYAFVFVFIAYWLVVQAEWHPLISAIPLSNDAVAITAVLETLKVFLLVWLPVTAVATAASVIGPERGERPVRASRLWDMIPGAIATLVIAGGTMALYAMLYAALPASNVAQMQQSLLGREVWTGALPYYLWFTPAAVLCYLLVSAVRLADPVPGVWMTLALAVSATAFIVLYLGWVTGFTAPTACQGGVGPISVWSVLWMLAPPWPAEERADLEACFSYYSTLDIVVVGAAAFFSVAGLTPIRLQNPLRTRSVVQGSLVLAIASGILFSSAGRTNGRDVVLGFRKEIRPFSFLAPAGEGSESRPYSGYIADLCYEIFDGSPYDRVQVTVTADDRFDVMRRPAGVSGPDATVGPRLRRADGKAGPPDTEGKVDVLCDAATIRIDDAQRMDAGVFSPIVFVSGVSYLWRSQRRFKEVEVGYVDNSTARRVAMEACRADAMRLGDGVEKFTCEAATPDNCLADKSAAVGTQAEHLQHESTPRARTKTLHQIRNETPRYVDCPKRDHKELIEWFCGTSEWDKVYFGDRDIILAKLEEWRDGGKDCGEPGDIRDPHQSYTYEPYAILVSRADPALIQFVQRRVYEIFSHRSGAEALFYKWFPGQTMSEPLAWLFLLNGVMDQDELLTGPKQFPSLMGAAAEAP